MKYKSVILTEQAYKELSAIKQDISKKAGKNISFSEVVENITGRKSLLLNLDGRLMEYINKFIEALKKYDDIKSVILFGSISKVTATKYSDIDLLVIVDGKAGEYYDIVHSTIMSLNAFKYELAMKGIFNYISPTIINEDDLKEFNPFYLDVADYGIILYDPFEIAKNFIERTKSIKHSRENTIYGEILKWKIKE